MEAVVVQKENSRDDYKCCCQAHGEDTQRILTRREDTRAGKRNSMRGGDRRLRERCEKNHVSPSCDARSCASDVPPIDRSVTMYTLPSSRLGRQRAAASKSKEGSISRRPGSDAQCLDGIAAIACRCRTPCDLFAPSLISILSSLATDSEKRTHGHSPFGPGERQQGQSRPPARCRASAASLPELTRQTRWTGTSWL